MTVALLVITDGRSGLIDQTIASAEESLEPRTAVSERFIYDDSGDIANHDALTRRFRRYTVFWHEAGRQGFGGAIRTAWAHLQEQSSASHIFHVEDDFTFNRPVPLHKMAAVLDANPQLAQMALRRQAWNPQEKAAGGVIEQHPDDYHDRDDGWLEHRLFFTTNPSLYRRDLIRAHEWPTGARSEGEFTRRLLEGGYSFGYWGSRDSSEWVHHNGVTRAGTDY